MYIVRSSFTKKMKISQTFTKIQWSLAPYGIMSRNTRIVSNLWHFKEFIFILSLYFHQNRYSVLYSFCFNWYFCLPLFQLKTKILMMIIFCHQSYEQNDVFKQKVATDVLCKNILPYRHNFKQIERCSMYELCSVNGIYCLKPCSHLSDRSASVPQWAPHQEPKHPLISAPATLSRLPYVPLLSAPTHRLWTPIDKVQTSSLAPSWSSDFISPIVMRSG